MLCLVTTAFAQQHFLQVDDGSGQYSTILGSNSGGPYTLAPGGGMIVTQPLPAGPSLGWLSAGNILTGGSSSTPDQFLGSNNSFDVVFKTGGLEFMRITTNGHVGLGANAPVSQLANTNANLILNGVGITTWGLNWENSDEGWTAIFNNTNSGGPNFNGIAVSLNDASTGSDALWVQSSAGTLLDVKANGDVYMTTSTTSVNALNIEGYLTRGITTTFDPGYNVGASDNVILDDATGGFFGASLILPPASQTGRVITVINTGIGGSDIGIFPGGGDAIQGGNPTISWNGGIGGSITFIADGGSTWYITASH